MKKYIPSQEALTIANSCHEHFFKTGMIGTYLLRNRMLEPVNEHLVASIKDNKKQMAAVATIALNNSLISKEELDYGEYQR